MRKLILLFLLVFSVTSRANPVNLSSIILPSGTYIQPSGYSIKEIGFLKIKDIQKISGRKLTLKEKIAFLLLKHQLKKNPEFIYEEAKSSPGKTALLFGILAILFALIPWYTLILAIPFGILAIIKGDEAIKSGNAEAKKGKAGKILGYSALGLLVLWLMILLIFVITLSTIFWSWG